MYCVEEGLLLFTSAKLVS